MSPEALYAQLRELATSAPDLSAPSLSIATPDILRWLGRLSALVDQVDNLIDISYLNLSIRRLQTGARQDAATEIMIILYRALARAEMDAPVALHGSFVPAGNSFDALAAISSILGDAESSIRIVDPYLDEKVLTFYATIASTGVTIELLSDQATAKPSLKSAAFAWVQQYSNVRPLEVRLAAPKSLHDRLIIVDAATVWDLSQSIKDFAARSPASASKADPELAALKIAAYDSVWLASRPL